MSTTVLFIWNPPVVDGAKFSAVNFPSSGLVSKGQDTLIFSSFVTYLRVILLINVAYKTVVYYPYADCLSTSVLS